jgi:hypothetical protein
MSDYILYGIPVIIFLIASLVIYSTQKPEPDENINYIKFLPAIIVGIIAFVIIKYKESTAEPTMMGNYFD